MDDQQEEDYITHHLECHQLLLVDAIIPSIQPITLDVFNPSTGSNENIIIMHELNTNKSQLASVNQTFSLIIIKTDRGYQGFVGCCLVPKW